MRRLFFASPLLMLMLTVAYLPLLIAALILDRML